MIKVAYYVGTYDKDICKKGLSDEQFIKTFDKLFVNYTLQKAQSVCTMGDTETVVKENTFIVTTFIKVRTVEELRQHVQRNCSILKEKLNQESILVEMCKPEVMFL